jgi:cyclopropane-fatty-acyl-phospholipid synthase
MKRYEYGVVERIPVSNFEERFKTAVRENFDASVEHYERFEEKHQLFENLTNKLIELMGGEGSVARVLDVGCGTGISTYCLFKFFGNNCTYYALDISQNMLDIAKNKYSNLGNFIFINGDAENLKDYFMETFDAIFYTASLFLLPDFKKSLQDALSLLNDNGKIGISFYAGLSDMSGKDLIKKNYPGFSYRYGAFTIFELTNFLKSKKIKNFTTDFFFPVDKSFLTDFLTIPAQSAGLFPRQSFSKQVSLVKEFIEDLYKFEKEVFMKWAFIIISK